MSKEMFSIVVTIKLTKGFEQEYMDLMTELLETMRSEPTYVNTTIHRRQDDPSTFVLYETWLDQDDFFKVQFYRDYRKKYEERVAAMSREPRTIDILEPLRRDFTFREVGKPL